MPSYLIQVAYTPQAVAAFIDKPQDRTEPIRKVVEKLGGKLDKLYLAFGDYDVVGIYELPDHVSAAAFALAISAAAPAKASKLLPSSVQKKESSRSRKRAAPATNRSPKNRRWNEWLL